MKNKGRNQPTERLLCFLVNIFLFFPLHLAAQTSLPRTTNVPLTQSIAGSEQQIYELPLAAKEYFNVTVDYSGVSLDIILQGPDKKPLAIRSNRVDTVGDFEGAIIAPISGTYQIILRGREKNSVTGSYKLEVKALRPATAQDYRYATAHRLLLEGDAFYDQRTADSRQQALRKYEEALPLWREIKEAHKEFATLESIAITLKMLSEFQRGLNISQEMLALARLHKMREQELEALRSLSSMHLAVDQYHEANQILQQALPLSRELKNRQMELLILNSLGVATASLGQGQTAIGFYQQALVLARESGNRGSEASILNNLATRWSRLGELENVVLYYQQALAIHRQLGNRDGEARVLNRLSEIKLQRGEFQQSLDFAQQSLALAQKSGNRLNEANALLQVGQIFQFLNDSASALSYLSESRVLHQALENRADEAYCLSQMGLVYLAAAEYNKAQDLLQQSLTIQRSIQRKGSITADLMNLGAVYLKQNSPEQAFGMLTEALTLSRDIKDVHLEAICLLHISRVYAVLEEKEEALASLRAALPLAQKVSNRLLEAEIQHDLALFALQQQQYEEAQTTIETALHIIENSRSGLTNPEMRAIYRSSTHDYYEIYTDVLVRRAQQQKNPQLAGQALESIERARAQSLLALLNERQVNIRQGVEEEILKSERELQLRRAAKMERLQALGNSQAAQTQSRELEAELTRIQVEIQEVEAKIRRVSPAYAALVKPQSLKFAELQQMLQPDTLLLEFALGTAQSYLFAVTPTTLQIFTLPKRTEIEAAVRNYYSLVEKRGELSVFSDVNSSKKFLAQFEEKQQEAARRLSEMLLQPVATAIQQKRLMIVPDGALQYVPFAALPAPKTPGKRVKDESRKSRKPPLRSVALRPHPLIMEHEILTLPSVSTLAITRQQLRTPAPKMIALLADPVFGVDDERVPTQTRGARNPPGERRYARLSRTRQEAQAILQFAPLTQRSVALDFEANLEWALSEQLNQYRYIHFATHGIWNEASPELSGLLLSQVDQEGHPQNGLLTTREVFNLKLSAELVVLSGCQTAQGKELRGEGLIGLTRGFMYAGARRVVASLWKVNDAATAKLMEYFYQGLLGEKRRTPAAALRAAQIAMWQDKRWSAPHYWAAFILQGEW